MDGRPLRVYLASRLKRRHELNRYRLALEACGVVVTSRWLTAELPDEPTEDIRRQLAEIDREDVQQADVLVLFTEPDRDGGGGRHVEFGLALGLGKRIIVVGEVENLFQRLPEVILAPTWDDALALLTQ